MRLRISAARMRPDHASSVPLEKIRGRRECRMLAAPASLACKENALFAHASNDRFSRNNRHSPRNGLRLIRDLLGAPGSLATVTLRIITARLDPSVGGSGPHDFAVRTGCPRLVQPPRPSHPAPNVRDDREPPLWRERDGRKETNDLPDGATPLFSREGLNRRIKLKGFAKSAF